MSYQINFKGKDGNWLVVGNEQGEKLKFAFAQGKQKMFSIENDVYMFNDIKSIIYLPENKQPEFDVEKFLTDGKCYGKYSIQQQINSIIQNDYPKDWAKLIQDTAFREELRQQLREATSEGWCDYREKECACYK